MNRPILALASILACAASARAEEAPAAPPAAAAKPKAAPAAKDPYKTDDERVLYTLGRALGRNVAPFNLAAPEIKVLQDGLRDQILGKPPAVDTEAYMPKVGELLRRRMGAAAEKEKAKGKAFAAEFAKQGGVSEIPGGGWIKHMTTGSGPAPTAEDDVKVHYRGSLTDGTEFDSSYKRGEPAQFGLSGGLISCWLKGVPLMKKGGKAQLLCPSDVAYGDEGRPPQIKGGASLLFEIELLDVVKPAPAPAAAAPEPEAKKK